MKTFIGTCVDNPFGTTRALQEVIDTARPICRSRFLAQAEVERTVLQQMSRFPRDYRFFQSGGVVYYEWSRIEHFYTR